MKNKLLLSFMLVCAALFVYHGATLGGITGKIAGVIKDAATGEQLPAVNIVIEGTTLGGATDNEGHYFIINIPPGTYSLQASMVGYAVESRTGVIVNVDHTTTIDFDLRVTAIAGEEVTVTAEREIVPMDISASHIVADAEQIVEVPMVTDIAQYIHLQAGIEGDYIRGGGLDQTQFMMDGLMVVDNRTNKPMMMVNLSSVKELNIIKGGFNAEYGNVRSGLINVVTREGSPSVYHGSFDFRYSPPHLKHNGVSIFSPDFYYLRPYLDPDVMWVGTENGTWTDEEKETYETFMGWNEYSKRLLGDDDPINDRTPEECRDIFLWRHALEGSGALGQKEGTYADRPDWNVDVSFGGPVPYISKYLGNLSFFASYRDNQEMFALPTNRNYYKEETTHLKLTSRLSQSMKLTLEGLYGKTNTVSRSGMLTSGTGMLSYNDKSYLYLPSSLSPHDHYQSMVGLSFDHVLSPNTFYNIRISNIFVKDVCSWYDRWRDKTILEYFGNTPVDEIPYGFWWRKTEEWGMFHPGHVVGGLRDWSETGTVNLKFDLTSQIDKYNQIKVGWMVNYDDLDTYRMWVSPGQEDEEWVKKWRHFPIRAGAYLQDKLEFEGMIANFGVRLDYNEPNCEWFTVDRYSQYFMKKYKDVFTEVAPKEPAKGHLKISPRLGVSHPISDNAKLYFNYGHFYSMPSSISMYEIDFGRKGSPAGISFIGNPSAELPQTVSYELGVEYNVRNWFLVHLSGYYKDVRDQTGSVSYTNFDGRVDYSTTENNNYADIRGFEFRLDKRFGRFITGWLNYNYMVTTSGYIGRNEYYEDERTQRITGLENPKQSRPLARPWLRVNLNIRTPGDWGPIVAGIKPLGDFHLSFLYTWKAGRYQTWDPLATFKLYDNVQWNGRHDLDNRISKRVRLGKYTVNLFADIRNLFNLKYMDSRGFYDSGDQEKYLESLHLKMYEGQEYQDVGYVPGDDKPGDVKSDDKPYINMPNRDFMTFLNPRTVFFGLKIDF